MCQMRDVLETRQKPTAGGLVVMDKLQYIQLSKQKAPLKEDWQDHEPL